MHFHNYRLFILQLVGTLLSKQTAVILPEAMLKQKQRMPYKFHNVILKVDFRSK